MIGLTIRTLVIIMLLAAAPIDDCLRYLASLPRDKLRSDERMQENFEAEPQLHISNDGLL